MTGRVDAVITGGGGRLGSIVALRLAEQGHAVALIDRAFPVWLHNRSPRITCHLADLLFSPRQEGTLDRVPWFREAGCVIHLAGLHGLHLVQGASARDMWVANVEGTLRVTSGVSAASTARFVFASSTAVYGPGSLAGDPALVLDEAREPNPDNCYALTKLVGEHVVGAAAGQGTTVVALRFGRFHRDDERAYQLRKLSTGLDLDDAADALVATATVPALPSGVYCVSSDLPLSGEERARLGLDSREVLDKHLPGFVDEAVGRGWDVPARVGRSVDSAQLQRVTRYRPRRTLRTVAERWRLAEPEPPSRTGSLLRAAAQRNGDPIS